MTSDGNNRKNASNGKPPSPTSHASHNSQPSDDRLLPPRGDYQTLLSFQKAEVIYDITFRFAHKYLSRGDRTVDQMIQSARSGKQNILEDSKAALTSKETEIKLTNVARASLEELLADYRDYLRTRDHAIWDKDCKEAQYVRKLGRKTPQTYEDYREFVETRPPEVIANIALCLIHQTNYLLDQQLRRLEEDFVKEGGLRERMTRARVRRGQCRWASDDESGVGIGRHAGRSRRRVRLDVRPAEGRGLSGREQSRRDPARLDKSGCVEEIQRHDRRVDAGQPGLGARRRQGQP